MNKILFVIGLTESGGAEKRALLISSLLKSEFNTFVFAFAGNKKSEIDFVYKNTYNDYKHTHIRERVKALREVIDQEKPDFVFSFLPQINFFVSCALHKRKYKNIIHIIGIAFHKYKFKDRLIFKLGVKGADGIYYQCHDQKEILNFKKPGFVIANPIVILDAASESSKHRFMSVGRLEYQKDYDLQIRAFRIIKNSITDATLDIFGSGSQLDSIKELISSLDLQECVNLHEYTNNIAKAYSEHDVFLFTSRYEGFPNALAEAMSYGLICFTTDFATGRKDLIIDNETGYLVKERDPNQFANIVITKLDDYKNAKQVACNGRKHVSKICDINNFVSTMTKELRNIKNGKEVK